MIFRKQHFATYFKYPFLFQWIHRNPFLSLDSLMKWGFKLRKKRKVLFSIVAISCVAVISLLCFSFISIGKYVQVVASTTPSTISMDCSLEDIFLLGSDYIESSEAIGDRLIVVRVFNGQKLLFDPIQRANVSNYIGLYVIKSQPFPGEVGPDSDLRVTIQLLDSAGNLLAEEEKAILYEWELTSNRYSGKFDIKLNGSYLTLVIFELFSVFS